LPINEKIDIPYGGEVTRKLPCGEGYKLEIKDDYNDKFCYVESFKITDEQTQTITYRGCSK